MVFRTQSSNRLFTAFVLTATSAQFLLECVSHPATTRAVAGKAMVTLILKTEDNVCEMSILETSSII